MSKRAKSITVKLDISALDDLDFYDQIKEIRITYVHMDEGTNRERSVPYEILR